MERMDVGGAGASGEGEQEACRYCGQAGGHAEDCPVFEYEQYEQKIQEYKAAEGITPEFEAGVASGEITFEKQMGEIERKVREAYEKTPEEFKSEFVNNFFEAGKLFRNLDVPDVKTLSPAHRDGYEYSKGMLRMFSGFVERLMDDEEFDINTQSFLSERLEAFINELKSFSESLGEAKR